MTTCKPENRYDFHEFANLLPMMSEDEFAELKDSIRQRGLQEPIWIFENKILDGRNRYRACLDVGAEPEFQNYVGTADDALELVKMWNKVRRNLNSSQSAVFEVRFNQMKARRLGEQARVRELAGKRDPTQTFEQGTRNDRTVAAQVAAGAGTNRTYVSDATKLESTNKDLADRVLAGHLSLPQAKQVAALPPERQRAVLRVAESTTDEEERRKLVRAEVGEQHRAKRIEKIAEIAQGNAPLQAPSKFAVIYADPPWRYEHAKTESRAIENHYPTMDLSEICALPVAKIATDAAVLFLWVTSPKLAESMKVIEAWDFTYRTCAVWTKDKMGMGYYFRQQHELLLVATRGEMPAPPVGARVSSVISGDRNEHSAKPPKFAEVIEAMYPELPKMEMFCRTPRVGWFVWGNQSA